jgi:hypothetical protein
MIQFWRESIPHTADVITGSINKRVDREEIMGRKNTEQTNTMKL